MICSYKQISGSTSVQKISTTVRRGQKQLLTSTRNYWSFSQMDYWYICHLSVTACSTVNFHYLLPPANEVCEGCVFTGVCLSTGGCLPHCMLGYTPPWQTTPGQTHPNGQTPLGRHPIDRHPLPWADTPSPGQTPPYTVHAGIRSTSGRYASHWNAFLFNFKLNMNANQKIYGGFGI